MLLVTRPDQTQPGEETFAARFLMQVAFVPCVGARDEAMARKLTKAFQNRSWSKVKSLRRSRSQLLAAGDGWSLSTN